MTDLGGRVAVVLGGESGIGLAIASALADAGAIVVIGGFMREAGEEARARLGDLAEFKHLDVRSAAAVDNLINGAAARHGRLDIMVYSAGVSDGFSRVSETSDALWDEVIDINLRGCFFAMRAALKIMEPAGRGRIINIASIAALRPSSNGAAYVAAKWGMVGLTRQAAATAANAGVTVNAICPGVIETDFRGNSALILGKQAPAMTRGVGATKDGYKAFVPAQRRGNPAEVAQMALYLAGDAASYVTGQAVGIDGGWSAT